MTQSRSGTSHAPVTISNIRFVAAGPDDVATGLLGYVSAVLNGALRLDGLALRRTAEGRLTLSFPFRRDHAGNQCFYLRPLNDIARQEIEHQVFQALVLEGGVR